MNFHIVRHTSLCNYTGIKSWAKNCAAGFSLEWFENYDDRIFWRKKKPYTQFNCLVQFALPVHMEIWMTQITCEHFFFSFLFLSISLFALSLSLSQKKGSSAENSLEIAYECTLYVMAQKVFGFPKIDSRNTNTHKHRQFLITHQLCLLHTRKHTRAHHTSTNLFAHLSLVIISLYICVFVSVRTITFNSNESNWFLSDSTP